MSRDDLFFVGVRLYGLWLVVTAGLSMLEVLLAFWTNGGLPGGPQGGRQAFSILFVLCTRWGIGALLLIGTPWVCRKLGRGAAAVESQRP